MTRWTGSTWLAVPLLVGACSGHSCPEIEPDTFVEAWLHQAYLEVTEPEWRGSLGGFAGSRPLARDGPTPELGECLVWSSAEDAPVEFYDRVTVSVEGVGAWELVQYQDGELDLESGELPDAPFLDEGTRVEARLGQLELEAPAPPAPTLEAPPRSEVIELPGPVSLQWEPQGEPSLELVLVFGTDGGRFRAAQTCLVPDTGSFVMPAIEEPISSDIGAAIVHLRYHRGAETRSEGTQFNLHVRQVFIREYDAQLSAPEP